jgi:hypothetical protein
LNRHHPTSFNAVFTAAADINDGEDDTYIFTKSKKIKYPHH